MILMTSQHWVQKVHLIVSSLQVLQSLSIPGKQGEHWSRFPAARRRLLQLLEDVDVAAPLLMSGDVHLGEFAFATCGNNLNREQEGEGGEAARGKLMMEVTSSGITHSWSQLPMPMRTFQRLYRWMVPQSYGECYFLFSLPACQSGCPHHTRGHYTLLFVSNRLV